MWRGKFHMRVAYFRQSDKNLHPFVKLLFRLKNSTSQYFKCKQITNEARMNYTQEQIPQLKWRPGTE